MTTNKRYVQLLAMAQTGKKLESWANSRKSKLIDKFEHRFIIMSKKIFKCKKY